MVGNTPSLGLDDLKAAVDAHAIVGVTDRFGTITYANDKFCEISKYRREELLGANHRIINSGFHPPEFFQAMWSTIASGRIWRGEIRNRARDGTIYWVDTTIVPLAGPDGSPEQYVSIRNDITERKEREFARRAKVAQRYRILNERLKAVVENEPHCIKIVSAQGFIEEINPAGLEMLEAPTVRLIGRPVLDFVHPEDRQAFLKMHERVLLGHVARLRFRIVGLRGTERWVDSHSVPLHGGEGETTSVLSVTLDITQELQAQQALRAQAQMLDSIGQAVIATDPQGAVVYANRAAEQLYERSRGEMLGRSIDEVTEPVTATGRRDAMIDAVREQGRFSGEVQRQRRDGGTFVAHMTVTPFVDASGRVAGMVGIAHDVTEEKRSRELVERSNRFWQMLTRCNEAMLRAPTERDLLREVADTIRDSGGFRIVQVVYALEPPQMSLALRAHSGPRRDWWAGLRLSWSAAEVARGGPAGIAVRTGEPVVIADAATHPDFAPWADSAGEIGYGAVVALPLMEAARAFGVLMLYIGQPGMIPGDELALLRELANDLSFGIQNLRAREQRRRIRDAAQAIAGAVVASSGEAFLQDLLAALVRAVGAQAGVVAQRAAAEGDPLRTLAAVVQGQASPHIGEPLAGMPFDEMRDHAVWSVQREAQSMYPHWSLLRTLQAQACVGATLAREARHDAAVVVLVFDQPLSNHETVEDLVGMFAARAAAELERQAAHDKLQQLHADLEERVRRRTEQLQAANRELNAFSYSVSHDLRAPLASINGFATVLQEQLGTDVPPRVAHALSRIRAGAVRMEELIEGLLAIAQLSRSVLHWEEVDLSAVAEACVADLAQGAAREGVAVEIQPGVRACGDRRLLRQVLANLLGNAWKFTSKRPTAHIEFGTERHEGDETVFFVRDDGAGFDMQYAGKLFGPFQRLHSHAEFPGTGIGLATVQRIVQRHGGRVWAEAPPAGGAKFCFTLGPAPRDEPEAG